MMGKFVIVVAMILMGVALTYGVWQGEPPDLVAVPALTPTMNGEGR